MHVRIATNDLDSGDWVTISVGNEIVYEGHSIGVVHLKHILESTKGFTELTYHSLDDDQMSEWYPPGWTSPEPD